ncbi:MAG: hypothetical protein EXS08_03185 [Planctomycetes bacterium]|nr:hypothetical protein [Planctomycetota bacterium]
MSALELERLAVPAVERGQPWRSGAGAAALRGRVYAPLPRALAEAVPRWFAALAVPEGVALKAPEVQRVGGVVVKLFLQPSLFGWLRAPRAVRSAERHFWCLPLRSPRPWIAVGRPFARASLLVREHVEGVLLRELAAPDARAEAGLATFLADMERHGVLHGDLHPRNLLWTGDEWVLLDVDGLRHGLHDRERVLVSQWARFVLHLGDERVRELHRRAAGRVAWDRVQARVTQMRRQRGGVPPV